MKERELPHDPGSVEAEGAIAPHRQEVQDDAAQAKATGGLHVHATESVGGPSQRDFAGPGAAFQRKPGRNSTLTGRDWSCKTCYR